MRRFLNPRRMRAGVGLFGGAGFSQGRRVSRGCSRSHACAVAFPWSRVSVVVTACSVPQVVGSPKTNSPPCLGGRPPLGSAGPNSLREGAGRRITRSERSRPRISTGRSPTVHELARESVGPGEAGCERRRPARSSGLQQVLGQVRGAGQQLRGMQQLRAAPFDELLEVRCAAAVVHRAAHAPAFGCMSVGRRRPRGQTLLNPWLPAARTASRTCWTGHDLRIPPKSLQYKVSLGRNGSTGSRDHGPARGEPSGEKTQDPRVGTRPQAPPVQRENDVRTSAHPDLLDRAEALTRRAQAGTFHRIDARHPDATDVGQYAVPLTEGFDDHVGRANGGKRGLWRVGMLRPSVHRHDSRLADIGGR